MFSVSLRHMEHTRRYSIQEQRGRGWEVTREDDRELTRHVCYQDWHRVERALAAFEFEVSELLARGWKRS